MSYTIEDIEKINDEIQSSIRKIIENNNLNCEFSNADIENDILDKDDLHSVIMDYYVCETGLIVMDKNNDLIFGGWYDIIVDEGKNLIIKDFHKTMERSGFKKI